MLMMTVAGVRKIVSCRVMYTLLCHGEMLRFLVRGRFLHYAQLNRESWLWTESDAIVPRPCHQARRQRPNIQTLLLLDDLLIREHFMVIAAQAVKLDNCAWSERTSAPLPNERKNPPKLKILFCIECAIIQSEDQVATARRSDSATLLANLYRPSDGGQGSHFQAWPIQGIC